MIYIENLHKTFDTVKAVNGVTLCMETGGIFGLPGTNGAGKSTLLRMMAGILGPL